METLPSLERLIGRERAGQTLQVRMSDIPHCSVEWEETVCLPRPVTRVSTVNSKDRRGSWLVLINGWTFGEVRWKVWTCVSLLWNSKRVYYYLFILLHEDELILNNTKRKL